MQLPGSRARKAKLVYVTPGHQFPVCTTMTLPRRLQLLEWARRSNAFIFEDDYDSEFRYTGRPIPALQGLDRQGSVIFSGTFSKVLFPGLRLGYLVLPPDLVEQFAAAKSSSTGTLPRLNRPCSCDFIVEGHFGRHLRRMREVYAERLSALMESARRRLGGLLELSNVEAGLQTIGWLPPGIDSVAAQKAAEKRKVEVIPLRSYARGPLPREGLQMGFAAVNPQEIRRGVHQLAWRLNNSPGPVYDVGLMPDQIADLFLSTSVKHMQLSEDGINRCLARLSDHQICIGKRTTKIPSPTFCSISKVIFGSGSCTALTASPTCVNGMRNSRSLSRGCDEVRSCFAATLAESRRVIGSLPPERLLEMINPQPTGNWGPMTILQAIYRIVAHLQMHTGQIILLTKQLVGTDLDLSLPRKR